MAHFCKELHVLPKAGGLFEQDAYHMYLLKAGLQAWAAKEEKDQKDAQAKTRR